VKLQSSSRPSTSKPRGDIMHGNICSCSFLVGDFILQKIQTTKDGHKLSQTWEGPYQVVEVTRPRSYRLQREDGSKVPNSWNDDQLRPFYV
jgi:hypothetical protein